MRTHAHTPTPTPTQIAITIIVTEAVSPCPMRKFFKLQAYLGGLFLFFLAKIKFCQLKWDILESRIWLTKGLFFLTKKVLEGSKERLKIQRRHEEELGAIAWVTTSLAKLEFIFLFSVGI